MEFLDTRDATEAEKKEIERILAANCSSVEFPFDPHDEDLALSSLIIKDDNCGLSNNIDNSLDSNKHGVPIDGNLLNGCNFIGHGGSNGPITALPPFSGPFVSNHIGTGVPSSGPYATLYSPKGGPLMPGENGEMLFYGPPYVSMANSSGPPPYAPPSIITSISNVPVVSPTLVDSAARAGPPLSSSSSSTNATVAAPVPTPAGLTPISMQTIGETTGNRVPVSLPSGAPYQMLHPAPPPGATYLPASAFRAHTGAFLPVPQHVYPSCLFPLTLAQYYPISHLTSSATSPPAAAIATAPGPATSSPLENNQNTQSVGAVNINTISPPTSTSPREELVECYENKDSIHDNPNAQRHLTLSPVNNLDESTSPAAPQQFEIVQQQIHKPQQTQSQPNSKKNTCDNSDESSKSELLNSSSVETSANHHRGKIIVNLHGGPKVPGKEIVNRTDENCLTENIDQINNKNTNVNNIPEDYRVEKKSRSSGSGKKDLSINFMNNMDNSVTKKNETNKENRDMKDPKDNKKHTNNMNSSANNDNDHTAVSSPTNITNSSSSSSAKANIINQLSISSNSTSSSSTRSWADLFKARNSNHNSSNYSNAFITSSLPPCNASSLRSLANDNQSEENHHNNAISSNKKFNETAAGFKVFQEDALANKLGKRLKDIHLKHSLPYLMPRGFVNRGNWCYINATLQALLYCPPFYNLMREIGEISGVFRDKSSTPIIDSFAKFFSNFLPSEPMIKKAKSNDFNGQEVPKGEQFEPKCIYDVLGQIKSECLKGKQEDAEEFLSSVLNGLHDEMVSIFKFNDKTPNGESNTVTANGHSSEDDITDQRSNNDDNDSNLWNVVGPKHKALPTRSTKVNESPIMEIFGGSMISVRTAGSDKCGNRQPFFTLQLDIQSEKIRSVEDALKSLTMRESIHGYQCPKTKQMVDASYQTFLDQLPPILILHLKLFIYDKDGGSKKLVKKIDYPIDLELPRECLHMDRSSDKNKYSKSYKLLSVVYHDGNESVKGHYLTDIFHIGSSNWLRCDDNNVKTISVQQLLNPQAPRVPYLLFYRRCDTLRGSSSSQQQRGSNNSASH